MSIEVKDCKKCVHVKSEANPNYFGGCEFCFRRNDLSDFYTEEGENEKEYKCPMYAEGICEKGLVPICKFNDKKCFVNPLVYSIYLKEIRERE